MKQVLGYIKDLVVSFFYDNYTGWKKKRIILVSACVVAIVVIIVSLVVIVTAPGGLLDKVEDIVTDIKETGVLPSGKPTKADIDATDGMIQEVPVSVEEIYQGLGPPALGDIESTGGVGDNEPVIENKEKYTNKYETWNTESELRSTAELNAEKIQNNYLLFMDTAIDNGTWQAFANDMTLVLLDAPALGEQVRKNCSAEVVAAWSKLEPIYRKLYEEIYVCSDVESFRAIAEGKTRQQAIELTKQFIEALNLRVDE